MNQMTVILRIAGFAMVLFSAIAPKGWADEVLLDWSTMDPGSSPPAVRGSFFFGAVGVLDVRVVDASTDPRNPFDDGNASLVVNVHEGQPFFRGWCRAFPENARSKGFFEWDFRLEEGGVSFTVGQNASAFNPPDVASFAFLNPGEEFLAMDFSPGQLASIRRNPVRTASVSELANGVNYRLRVEWDFASDVPGFRFFLNGEPLENLSDNAPFFFPATPEQVARGVDSFSFCTTVPSKCFFGRFAAGEQLLP